MNRLRIRSESRPARCEICHQSDCFDAEQNSCSRCASLIRPSPVIAVTPANRVIIDQTTAFRAGLKVSLNVVTNIALASIMVVITGVLLGLMVLGIGPLIWFFHYPFGLIFVSLFMLLYSREHDWNKFFLAILDIKICVVVSALLWYLISAIYADDGGTIKLAIFGGIIGGYLGLFIGIFRILLGLENCSPLNPPIKRRLSSGIF